MPKVPMDYSKTHFYKIVCKNPNIQDLYIGHTTEFTKRKNQHKTRCCNPENPKHHFTVYRFIRDNGHWENWEMVLIHTLHCENKLDALRIEREIFDELKPTLNILKPMTTNEEKKSYQQEWYVKNIDTVSEKHKRYRDEHAEQFKQDRKDNPEKYRERDRQNYLNRPPEFFENQKRKVECSCGGRYSISNKSFHFKTRKHQDYLETLEN